MAAAAQAADIKLGFAAPLTGPQSHYGEDMQNGLNLALEEANQKGIQIDGKPAKFVLVSRDDQADPRVGVQVAQQLVDESVVGILGHFNSGTTIPASRVYHEAGLPQIAMATSPEYTKQGYETTFRMMTSDTQQGAAVGKFMVQSLKAKKVAIIDDRTAYGQGPGRRGRRPSRPPAADRAPRVHHRQGQRLHGHPDQHQGSAPDAIFYGGLDAQSGPMKRQLATLGLKAPLVSGEMTRSDTFIKLAGDAADGTYASLAGVPLDKMAAGKDFEQRYQARFKKAPGVYAPYAYDGAWNMITAIEQAGSAKPEVPAGAGQAEPQGRHQREHRLRQERRSEGNLGHHLRSQERQVGDG